MNNNHTITLTNSNSVFVQTKLDQASLVTKEDKKTENLCLANSPCARR